MSNPVLSLCIPTNGVVEWVFPVLDSIYCQEYDNSLFEVIVTDNGDNKDFKNKMYEYIKNHTNLSYIETKALPFMNEIESYKIAKGYLIKFVNHRTKLLPGTISKLVEYTKSNLETKPITYFSNGVLDVDNIVYYYSTFNDFVKNLSYWSSWSTGMAIWKDDFKKLSKDLNNYNELFPHTNILFNERNRNNYVIDNTIIFDEIPQGNKPKGNYDVFYAFGIEYPSIIETLLKDGDIKKDTYKFVLNKNLEFITLMYIEYFIYKNYCSYDLSGLNRMYGHYYSKLDLYKMLIIYFAGQAKNRIKRTFSIR